jgi:hypothetical protein
MDYAKFELADGGTVLVEVEPEDGVVRVGRGGEIVRSVGKTFDESIGHVRDAATAALH